MLQPAQVVAGGSLGGPCLPRRGACEVGSPLGRPLWRVSDLNQGKAGKHRAAFSLALSLVHWEAMGHV